MNEVNHELPIEIGKPATNALLAAGITKLEQVAKLSDKELLAIHGVGPKAIRILRSYNVPSFFKSFIENLTSEQQESLIQLRLDILSAAPGAEETISSGIPAFRFKGKYLTSINATKKHLALYMMQGETLKKLKDDLAKYDTTNVAIRFSTDTPIPANLVKKIITSRMKEIVANN